MAEQFWVLFFFFWLGDRQHIQSFKIWKDFGLVLKPKGSFIHFLYVWLLSTCYGPDTVSSFDRFFCNLVEEIKSVPDTITTGKKVTCPIKDSQIVIDFFSSSIPMLKTL